MSTAAGWKGVYSRKRIDVIPLISKGRNHCLYYRKKLHAWTEGATSGVWVCEWEDLGNLSGVLDRAVAALGDSSVLAQSPEVFLSAARRQRKLGWNTNGKMEHNTKLERQRKARGLRCDFAILQKAGGLTPLMT